MKRSGGLAAVALLVLVFALMEIRATFAQAQRRAITYTDGSRYDGEILNGKRHGLGTYVYSDGSRYSGDWRDGKKHGRGTYTWTDGTRHVGEFRHDNFHGQGIRNWPNGNLYSGDWREDKMHGRGTYTWADGGRYVGELRNDNFHGRGTRTWPDGRRYEGQWRDDRMHGRGTMIRADGSSYEGEWRDGRRSDRLAPERQGQVRQQVRARNAEGRSQTQRNPSDPKAEERRLGLTQGMRKQIQSCLKMQGFDPGPSDGLIGPRTRAAIRSWQVAHSHGQREAGGYLSEGDLSALLAGCQVAEQRELTPEKQTERPAHESQGQREATEAPELQRQNTDYWSELQRRRQREQLGATSTQREMERQRQTQQQARQQEQQTAEAQSRQQTESVDSTELFRWLKRGESSEARAKILDLLDKGANPNVTGAKGNTPMHYAALQTHTKGVLLALMRRGGRCDAENRAGETPLHFAANVTRPPVEGFLKLLIECGANPNARSKSGDTPLHKAFQPLSGKELYSQWQPHIILDPESHAQNERTIGRLLRYGSDPNIKDANGDSSFMLAIKMLASPRIVEMLLAHGANPNTQNRYGRSALEAAANMAHESTPHGEDMWRVIELLIRAGADMDEREHGTVLHRAAAQAHLKAVKTLLELGADPNKQDTAGDTPLHLAARTDNLPVIGALLAAGADPNIRDNAGATPMRHAYTEEARGMIEAAMKRRSATRTPPPPGTHPRPVAAPKNNYECCAEGAKATRAQFELDDCCGRCGKLSFSDARYECDRRCVDTLGETLVRAAKVYWACYEEYAENLFNNSYFDCDGREYSSMMLILNVMHCKKELPGISVRSGKGRR